MRLADLNQHLEQKVAEQTADVRRAYDVEKKARAGLEELNAAKDEFIRKTQHYLRTPLTSIKWALETLRANAGHAPDAAAKEIGKIVEDFITVTEETIRLT